MGSSTTQCVNDPVGPSGTWHLCWQAAVGRDFCTDPRLRDRIRHRLLEAHRQTGRVLISYCLLPSEIHVVSRLAADDSAASLARAIGTIVARWAREAQPIRSPGLAGRYRAHPIVSVADLLEELRLLAWRPVWLGLCRTPAQCPYGATRIALGLTPARGFDSRALLQHFGQTVPQARVGLRAWIGERPDERQCRAWELMHGLSLATGSVGPQVAMAREVKGEAAAGLVAAGGAAGIDGALRLLEHWVAARIGRSRAADPLDPGGLLTARGRAVVALLADVHGLCSAASVARYFGKSKATISEQMSNCRTDPVVQQILTVPVERIIQEATALTAAAAPARCVWPRSSGGAGLRGLGGREPTLLDQRVGCEPAEREDPGDRHPRIQGRKDGLRVDAPGREMRFVHDVVPPRFGIAVTAQDVASLNDAGGRCVAALSPNRCDQGRGAAAEAAPP